MAGMAKHAVKKSRVPLLLLVLLCILALICTSLWVALRHGIVINRIDISSVKAERISVQVDDGIIFAIDRLEVFDRETTDSELNPELLITRFNEWAHLFREIRLNQIHYRGQNYKLLFKDNQFTVSGDNFNISSTIAYAEGEVRLNISELEIKPYALTLAGKSTYDLETRKFDISGGYSGQEMSGQFALSYHQDRVDAEINTNQFTDLTGFLARFPLDQELTTWISENITARNYLIEELRLGLTLRDGKPDFKPDSITGKGIATDAAIRFEPSLPPVQCKRIDISYENDQLSFDLDEPMYKTKSLAGSNVTIDHVVIGKSQMDINIRTRAQLDSDVLQLLKAYDINLPFSQQEGLTEANLHLFFDMPDFNLRTKGLFTTGEGNWTWENVSFQTSGAVVQLEDHLVTIDNAEIEYQDMIQTHLIGTIDTDKQQAALTADIENLNIRDKEKDVFRAQNLITPVNIQFMSDDVNIHLSMLQANITHSPSRNFISLANLNAAKPFIPFLQDFPFQDGKLDIDFTDHTNLKFDGFIETNVLPLSLNNKPVTQFTFHGSKTPEKLTATINEEKISLTVTDKLHIDLKDYLVIVDTDKIGKKAGPSSPVPISIIGPRSLIIWEVNSIPTKAFKAELVGSEVAFIADLNQGKILFQSNDMGMALTASEIDAQIAKDFFPFADLQGGRFNLSLKGKDKKNYEGFVEFSNVLIKDLATLNNVLSFMNTIPALATFSSPGFDENGYHVTEGVAHFNVINSLLTIQQLRTEGTTINLEALGWIDFENDTLQLNVEFISLKDYSKIIDFIPLAGYAILGEEGTLSTSLDITGSREHPEITTHLTSEIVMIPINIIKRVINWPFWIVDKITEYESQQPETGE